MPQIERTEVKTEVDKEEADFLRSLGLKTLLESHCGGEGGKPWHFLAGAIGLMLVGAACSTAYNRHQLTETVMPPAASNTQPQKWASLFAKKDNEFEVPKPLVGLGSYDTLLPVAWSATSESQLVNMIFEVSHHEGSEGLNRKLKSDGATLAHLFIQKDVSLGVFQVFVDAGGRLDVQKNHGGQGGRRSEAGAGGGDTPLMKAVRMGSFQMAKGLIETFTPEQLGMHKVYRGKDVLGILTNKISKMENHLKKIDPKDVNGKIQTNLTLLRCNQMKRLLLSMSAAKQI